ncbi:MAG: TIM barrel protein [Thermoguttaceae bacterium]
MFVAASTTCFPNLPLSDAFQKLVDLEYSCTEIAIHEHGRQFKPSEVVENLDRAIDICRNTHRLDVCSYNLKIDATDQEHYRQFAAICKLAKATKVVSITVPSAEVGTPFNQEVEHLRELVGIASVDGVRVSTSSQLGRLSADPDTVSVLCGNVKGLGLTFDPSHYICQPNAEVDAQKVIKYVYHVRLRDTSKEALQVRVGKGVVEFGRLLTQLRQVGYNRALCVDITEMPEVDHMAEMRKMRLLLESLL